MRLFRLAPKTAILVLGVLFGLLSNSYGQIKKDTISVLFIGNSYTYYNNLAQMIGLISDSMDIKIICRKSTAGGASLSDHWNGLRGLKTIEKLNERNYNIVVLQDYSLQAIEKPDTMLYYGNMFSNIIRKKGSKIFLYNTWARKTDPSTQPNIDKMYKSLAESNDATLVPIGKYWQRIMELNSSVELFHTDGSHPSHVGSFLNALAFVKHITGKLPKRFATVYNYIDKDGESFRIMQLTKEEIELCVRVLTEHDSTQKSK
jgi:hypothetical protein